MTLSPGSSANELIAHDGDRVERVYAVVSGGRTWVFHDGIAYELAESAPRRRRAGVQESLAAPMPATVIAVNVKAGAQVRRGDILVVLEAMKMELTIKAPAAGRVEAVHFASGQQVKEGDELLTIVSEDKGH